MTAAFIRRPGWKLSFIVLAYLAAASALLIRSHGLPYGSDSNETFSSAVHARNLSLFSWRRSYGLTDESYGVSSAAHPFIHSHQGNFPRVFTYLLYAGGARTVEAQIVATAYSAGLAAFILAFLFLSQAVNPRFAVLACLVFLSDYFLFGQWHLNTYRVWHCFFFFSSLLCTLCFCRRPSRAAAMVTGFNFVCLCYWEYVFAFFVLGLAAIYAAALCRRHLRRALAFWSLELAGALGAGLLLGAQLTAYMGWDGVKQDIAYTLHGRNSAFDPDFVAKATAFYAQHKVLWWPNYVDAAPLRHLAAFFNLLLRDHLEYYTPWLAFLMVIAVVAWSMAQWRMRRPLGLSLLLASGALILACLWLNSPSLFDWNPASFWRAAGWPGGCWQVVGLVGTTLAAIVLLAVGPGIVSRQATRAARRFLLFLGAGCLAYGLTYRVFTGYVYSGYLNRQAPFLVFLSDPLLALVLYLPLSILAVSWTRWRWSRRLVGPARLRLGLASIAAALAGGWIALALTLGWLRLQREYFRAMPPDRYEFVKQLAHPPFLGASFVVNTYAAPMAVETESWAYMEPAMFDGNIHLTRSGFQLDREDTYKWLSDLATNHAYEKPAYALIIKPTGWSSMLADYLYKHGAGPPQARLDQTYGLLRKASQPFSSFLHHQLVETDPDHDRDAFAIVRLDWDYPAYLRPLQVGTSLPDLEEMRPIDQQWLIEVQPEAIGQAGSIGNVQVAGISDETERVDLAAGALSVCRGSEPALPGGFTSSTPRPTGPLERLEAGITGQYLQIELVKGPQAGKAHLLVNDMEGDVDLYAAQPGVLTLRFSASKSFEESTIRPTPRAGQYVALRHTGSGLDLAYQFKHQENHAEENTHIDITGERSANRWDLIESVVLVGQIGVPIDLFVFMQQNPDTLAEYERIRRAGDPRTYLQWLADHFASHPAEYSRPGVLGRTGITAASGSPRDPAVRHIFLPLPAHAPRVIRAWVRPGTRTKVGPIYPSNAIDLAGTSRGKARASGANNFEEPITSMLGTVDLDLRFPTGRLGQSEPLLTTGVTGAGDFVYVIYLDAAHVRLGFDHWGVGGFLSPPLPLDYQAIHHLKISMGSLTPSDADPALRGVAQADIDALKSRVVLVIDGRIALAVEAESYETLPASVTVGENQIGGSTTGPHFTGQILGTHWPPLPELNEGSAKERP